MLNYVLHIVTTLLALFYLAKDWESHKKSWRRMTVLGLITLFGIFGIINTNVTNTKISHQRQIDQKQISTLKTEIVGLKSAFVYSLGQVENGIHNLSQQVSDLRTQRNAVEFEKKADQLDADLKAKANAVYRLKAVIEAKAGMTTDATVTHGADAMAKQPSQMLQKDIPEALKETDIRESVQRMLDNW